MCIINDIDAYHCAWDSLRILASYKWDIQRSAVACRNGKSIKSK